MDPVASPPARRVARAAGRRGCSGVLFEPFVALALFVSDIESLSLVDQAEWLVAPLTVESADPIF